MIKPPFTLLILKDSHHPVTIRVTTGLLLLFLIFPVVVLLAGAGVAYHFNDNIRAVFSHQPASSGSYVSESGRVKPDSLLVRVDDDFNIHISFAPVMPSQGESLFFWLMINPHHNSTHPFVILPRNPILNDFPVDFRNGFEQNIVEHTTFQIPLEHHVDIADIRILAYTDNGSIHIDQTFTIDKSVTPE